MNDIIKRNFSKKWHLRLNKYLDMIPRWGSMPRLRDWLTVSRNVTLTLTSTLLFFIIITVITIMENNIELVSFVLLSTYPWRWYKCSVMYPSTLNEAKTHNAHTNGTHLHIVMKIHYDSHPRRYLAYKLTYWNSPQVRNTFNTTQPWENNIHIMRGYKERGFKWYTTHRNLSLHMRN
jgi:hypothetical protein